MPSLDTPALWAALVLSAIAGCLVGAALGGSYVADRLGAPSVIEAIQIGRDGVATAEHGAESLWACTASVEGLRATLTRCLRDPQARCTCPNGVRPGAAP